MRWERTIISSLAIALSSCAGQNLDAASPARFGPFSIETRQETLDNGLRVVMARNPSVPLASLGVYYAVGFRAEPRGRTGFAHLMEHILADGGRQGQGGAFDDLIYGAGGVNGGATRYDFTSYFEIVPTNALEAALWFEADRMRGPSIDDSMVEAQKKIVVNEVHANVLNQPYGGWSWLHLPMAAYENWSNAHNFYGDLSDLEAATAEEAQRFFETYYGPNNATLVIVGDIDYDETLAWVRRHFGSIPKIREAPSGNHAEPRQTEEKVSVKVDPLAPDPGYSAAYHMPVRGTPHWYAMGLIDQILLQGADARLSQSLVRERGFTGRVGGGINPLGNMFTYGGPMLWSFSFVYDKSREPTEVTNAVDEVIEDLRTRPVTMAELDRARVKMRTQFYSAIETPTRFGLMHMLAAFALFDSDPSRINDLERGFAAVTPELILATAQEYLRPSNRTILLIEAGAATGTGL